LNDQDIKRFVKFVSRGLAFFLVKYRETIFKTIEVQNPHLYYFNTISVIL